VAAFVSNIATFNTTAGNKTAAITPSVGDLLVVVASCSGTATPPTITDNQTGGTYSASNVATRTGTVASVRWFVRDALVTSAVSHTVTMTSPGGDTGGGLVVMRFSGMSRAGTSAIKQSAILENTTGTPTITFSSAALTGNPTVGAIVNAANPPTMTPPTNWTERQDIGYTSPAFGIEVVTRDSGFTGTGITWGSSSSTAVSGVIMELDASAAGTNFNKSQTGANITFAAGTNTKALVLAKTGAVKNITFSAGANTKSSALAKTGTVKNITFAAGTNSGQFTPAGLNLNKSQTGAAITFAAGSNTKALTLGKTGAVANITFAAGTDTKALGLGKAGSVRNITFLAGSNTAQKALGKSSAVATVLFGAGTNTKSRACNKTSSVAVLSFVAGSHDGGYQGTEPEPKSSTVAVAVIDPFGSRKIRWVHPGLRRG